MDCAYTTVRSLLMPSSVRKSAEFSVVTNVTYRQIYSAEPFFSSADPRSPCYIGDTYETSAWALMENDQQATLLWMVTLAVLEYETAAQLYMCVQKSCAAEQHALLKRQYPDGLFFNDQWRSRL